MPRAELTVELPDGHWAGDRTREYPGVGLRVMSVVGNGERVFHLDIRGEAAAELAAGLSDHESVTDAEVLARHEEGVRVLVAVTEDRVMAAVSAALTPIRFPLAVADGTARLEVVTLDRHLSELGERLDAAGVTWSVDRVRQSTPAESLLTTRQRHVLETALELGYYDTPRTCTLTALADALGVAKSTCSETLHRAESAVMRQFLGAKRGDEAAGGDPERPRTVRSSG